MMKSNYGMINLIEFDLKQCLCTLHIIMLGMDIFYIHIRM